MIPERSIFSDTAPPFGPRKLRETAAERLKGMFGSQERPRATRMCPECRRAVSSTREWCPYCSEPLEGVK